MYTKKLLCTALLCAVSFIAAKAQLNNGLIAHWPFSNNAGDSSGKTHHGTAVFTTYSQGENGAANTAAVFNGTSTYINVGYQTDLNLSQYTICAIVKPMGYYTGLCQGNVIIQRSTESLGGYYGVLFSDNPYNDCNAFDTTKMCFYPSATAANPATLQYTPNIVTNNWYKLVVTYRNDSVKFYVNGVLKSSYVTNIPTGTSTHGITIGALYQQTTGSYPYWFKGLMDDIRIYNRVLTATEISYYNRDLYFVTPVNTSLCKNVQFNINYNTVNEYLPTNTFSVELSDATGSFASPTVIGTTTATRGGIITCIVPGTATVGTGYRLRIKSSLPAKISDTVNVAVNVPGTPPTVSITVAPGASVSNGANAFYTSLPSNAGSSPSYIWKKNGVAIPGANSLTYTAKAGTDFVTGDSISLVIKSSNICATPDSAESNKIKMTVLTTSINEIAKNSSFYVYPNPNNGSFSITGEQLPNGNLQIDVVNILGQIVYSDNENIQNGMLNKQITIDHLSKGIYTVRLQSEAALTTLKIHVQ